MMACHLRGTLPLLIVGVILLTQYVPLSSHADTVEYLPGAPLDLPQFIWREIFEMREHYQRVLGEVPKYYATPLIYDAIESGEYDTSVASSTPTTQGYTLRYTGTYCNIYVDTRVSVSDATINSMGSLFDSKIFPTDTSWFNKKGDVTFAYIYIYPMDGGGGVGGYFNPYTPNNIYIDSYDLSWADEIMAHEFQHLIHYREDPNESTWLNEGCSDLAAYVNFGLSASGLRSHLYYFYRFPNNNLLDFRDGVYGIDDYGAAASFMIYLMEKYGGKNFIRNLVHNTQNSATSITSTLSSHGYSKDFWAVFNDWKVALLLDTTSYGDGQYGFTSYNMKVSDSAMSATFSSYPVSYSTPSELKSYAPYFYKMTDGMENLGITFQGENSQFNVRLVMMSSSTVVSVKTLPMSGSSGEMALQGFGTEYDRIYFIPSTTSSGGFSVNIDIKDLVPPITNLTINPPEPDGEGGWYVTSPLVSLETEEGAKTYFRIDDGEFTLYSSPFYMPEGVHTLYYYSVDKYNNVEEVKSRLFRVDTTPPYSVATVSPPEPDGDDGWYITQPSVNLSGEEGAVILYKMDDGRAQIAPDVITIPDGVHYLTYWAVDQAGNVEENHTLFFKVDTQPPRIDYSINPEFPDGEHEFYVTQPTIALHAQEEATIYYK
ncbi:MAG: hypothetical protein J7L88_03680, partial [Thermoplasmata archaeon]|nr:hypothetical protein [Thermoplasmata archaeon]